MPHYDPLLPSFQRSLPTLAPLTRNTTPTSTTNTDRPPDSSQAAPSEIDATPHPTKYNNISPTMEDSSAQHQQLPLRQDQGAAPRQDAEQRPASLSPHINPQSRTRTLTSADRSTVHSPPQNQVPWQAAGSVKREDEDASSSAPALSPSSPIAPIHQHQQAYQQVHQQQPPHHYQYAQQGYQDPNQYAPHSSHYVPQGPPVPPAPQAPAGYPPQAAYAYPPQPPQYARPPINFQPQYHQPHDVYPVQQPGVPAPHPNHNPADQRCNCPDCQGAYAYSQAFAQSVSEPGREQQPFAGWGAPPGTSLPEHQAAWMQNLRPRAASTGTRQPQWEDPRLVAPPQSHMHVQQHMPLQEAPHQAPYPPERGGYPQQDPSRWPGQGFEYRPPSMYPHPPSAPGPSAMPSSSSSSVNWATSPTSAAGPSSPVQPSSPNSLKSEKPVKHKSRKTWTEAEWKKLTELAEQSKRGDPNAEIDWDYVTNGFGGRRCRQGILTVAAKRHLKVSTREARTIGKRARSAEDSDGGV